MKQKCKILIKSLKSLNVQLVKCTFTHCVWIEDDITRFTDVTTGQVLKGYRNPCKLKLVEYGLNDTYTLKKLFIRVCGSGLISQSRIL